MVRPDPAPSRTYDNSGRRERARQTRARIVAAARESFVADGYAATTLSKVAAAAGVSVPTVQKVFGTKAALAKAVYDDTLAGDDVQLPMAQRPVFQRLEAEDNPHETLRLYSEIAGDLWSRLGAIYPAILGGALAGDPDLVELRHTISQESRIASTQLVDRLIEIDGLRPDLEREAAIDTLWWLIQPEQHTMLVGQAGWHRDRLVRWFRETAGRLLLAPGPGCHRA